MGKIIITNDLITVGNSQITARSETTGYPKVNTQLFHILERRFMAADNNTNDYLLKVDFGAATTISAIGLFDVNFDTVSVEGNDTDAWGAPSYDGSDLTVAQNIWTGRYNIYIPLTAFSYRYCRLFIPTGTTEIGTSLSKWRLSSMAFLSASESLTRNMSYGFEQTSSQFTQDYSLPSGRMESVSLSEIVKWSGKMKFGNRDRLYESELAALNRLTASTPVIIYLNDDDTSEVYMTRRVASIQSTWQGPNIMDGGTLSFEEWI